MRARYYDPKVGRFISEDPIGFDGGDVNLYAYVQNNPIMGVDPSGLCSVPLAPPGADLNYNIGVSELVGSGGLLYWYDQVRNKGPWDYKQQGRQYEDFGNFNYGATGAALGIPQQVLLRGAGLLSNGLSNGVN